MFNAIINFLRNIFIRIRDFCENYKKNIIIDLLGLRFIWEKINPPIENEKTKSSSTFTIWFIGIYFVVWGLAMTKYEFKSNNIQYQTSNVTAILLEGEKEDIDYSIVVDLQNKKLPIEPKINNPIDTINSLFELRTYKVNSNVRLIKNYIKLNKRYLSTSNLRMADLSKMDLMGIDLSGANLSKVDLSKSNLRKANLNGAYLSDSNLREADLRWANLSKATLWADLSKANLWKVDLTKANLIKTYLTDNQIKQVKTLYKAVFKDEHFDNTKLLKRVKEIAPEKLEKTKE